MLWRPAAVAPTGTTRIAVDVTFLRMASAPLAEPAPMPGGVSVVRVADATPAFYRFLYDQVGSPYCWWLRRGLSDTRLAALIDQPGWSLHVLYSKGAPGGFYELERRGQEINLAYFGLLPHLVGQGLGRALLESAVGQAWAQGPVAMRVNTCTADHPRALGLYLSAGFQKLRTVREIWDIPDHLGLQVPQGLRA